MPDSFGVKDAQAAVVVAAMAAEPPVEPEGARAEAEAQSVAHTEAEAEAEAQWKQAQLEEERERADQQLNRRLLAFRQYIEVKREAAKNVRKHWRIVVERPPRLCETVLEHFSTLLHKDRWRARGLLFTDTNVTFLNAWGGEEDGRDEGGLSAEMFSLFWHEVLLTTDYWLLATHYSLLTTYYLLLAKCSPFSGVRCY